MSELSTVEVLREARKLIEDPERWTQGLNATTRNGLAVPSDSPDAACFCANGALLHAGDDVAESPAYVVLCHAAGGDLIRFNDTHSHAEVLDLFDRAIAEAERES